MSSGKRKAHGDDILTDTLSQKPVHKPKRTSSLALRKSGAKLACFKCGSMVAIQKLHPDRKVTLLCGHTRSL